MPAKRILYDLLRSGVADPDREAWVRRSNSRPRRSSPRSSGAVNSLHRKQSEVPERSGPSHSDNSGSQGPVSNGRHAWGTGTAYQSHASETSEDARSLEGNTAGGGSTRPTGSCNPGSEIRTTRFRAMPFREAPSQQESRPTHKSSASSQKGGRTHPDGRPATRAARSSSSREGPRSSPEARALVAAEANPSHGLTEIPRTSSLGMIARYFGLSPEDLFDCKATLERQASLDYVDGSIERHVGWLRLNKGKTGAEKVEGMNTFLEVEPMTCQGKVGTAELFGMLSGTWRSLDETAREKIFSDSESRHNIWLAKLRADFETKLASTTESKRDSLCRQHVQTTMANFRPDDSEIQRLVQEERARNFAARGGHRD